MSFLIFYPRIIESLSLANRQFYTTAGPLSYKPLVGEAEHSTCLCSRQTRRRPPMLSFPWNAGGTCDLLLTHGIWQRWWDVTRAGRLYYLAKVIACHSMVTSPSTDCILAGWIQTFSLVAWWSKQSSKELQAPSRIWGWPPADRQQKARLSFIQLQVNKFC